MSSAYEHSLPQKAVGNGVETRTVLCVAVMTQWVSCTMMRNCPQMHPPPPQKQSDSCNYGMRNKSSNSHGNCFGAEIVCLAIDSFALGIIGVVLQLYLRH
jgi:hypothetical protein